tara:strand:- start:194 stop:439 length:246 start_codon:yes stop_codon:yes gene_type:complete
MKVSQAHRDRVQLIEMGSLDHGVAVGAYISVALVVGDHQDNVWFPGFCGCPDARQEERKQGQQYGKVSWEACHGFVPVVVV